MEREFELKSIKRDALLGADLRYIVTETDDDGVSITREMKVKDARPLHEDLVSLFEDDLSELVGKYFELAEFGATGISFSGKDENVGCVIQGIIYTPWGDMKIKLPRIKFLASDAPLCAELTVIQQKIISEVDAYLFDGKCADLEVFDAA